MVIKRIDQPLLSAKQACTSKRYDPIPGIRSQPCREKAQNQQVPGTECLIFTVHSTYDARVIYSVDLFLQASLILHEAVFRLYI